MFVAKPLTKFLSNCEVSDGVKSLAMIITSSSIAVGSGNFLPNKCAFHLVETSLMSAALSLKYASSIDENILIIIVATSSKAAAAFNFSSLILPSI